MKAGETVLVRVNGGQLMKGEVIEIHGDIVRVAGPEEMTIVRAAGRPPLGIGFRVRDIVTVEKVNRVLT